MFCAELLQGMEMNQRIERMIDFQINISALAPISSIRATTVNKFFLSKGDTSIAAFASNELDLGLVAEERHGKKLAAVSL
jgi:hypothetical protein